MLQFDTKAVSVAQRTLIPRRIPKALTVLTVPEEDIGSVSDVKQLAPRLFGVPPKFTLNKDEYFRVADLIRGPNLWEAVKDDYSRLVLPEGLAEIETLDEMERFREDFNRQVSTPFYFNYPAVARLLNLHLDAQDIADSFGEHAIIGQLETRSSPELVGNTLFPNLPPLSYLLDGYRGGNVRRVLAEYQLTIDKLLLGLQIQTTAMRPSSDVREAMADLHSYEIPFGNSPQMSSETLLSLLRNARQVALIPLVYGAFAVAGHIEAGQYVLAMKASAASGTAYFAFAAPIEIHSLITDALMRRRGNGEDAPSTTQPDADE